MARKKLAPIHPGEVLAEEFLKPLDITQYRLAKGLKVPARRINEIVLGKRAISADTALRLGPFFGNSARFWLNLQISYDLALELSGNALLELGARAARSKHTRRHLRLQRRSHTRFRRRARRARRATAARSRARPELARSCFGPAPRWWRARSSPLS